MNHLRIDTTDVILQEIGSEKGKIIISDDNWGYNFSYYWCSMGCSLYEFLLKINDEYFVNKLSTRRRGDFDAKKTLTQVRKHIREEILHWYEHMEFQKDLRLELRSLERDSYSDQSFVDGWYNMVNYNLNYYLIEDNYDRKYVEGCFTGLEEPWNFIYYKEPRENIWLKQFFKKLQKALKNNYVTFVPSTSYS